MKKYLLEAIMSNFTIFHEEGSVQLKNMEALVT